MSHKTRLMTRHAVFWLWNAAMRGPAWEDDISAVLHHQPFWYDHVNYSLRVCVFSLTYHFDPWLNKGTTTLMSVHTLLLLEALPADQLGEIIQSPYKAPPAGLMSANSPSQSLLITGRWNSKMWLCFQNTFRRSCVPLLPPLSDVTAQFSFKEVKSSNSDLYIVIFSHICIFATAPYQHVNKRVYSLEAINLMITFLV